MDTIDKIIKYEQDNLSDHEIISLFQHLINDGSVWKMQGHYGRMAKLLIENGLCSIEKDEEV